MNLQSPHMTRVAALLALSAHKTDGTNYEAARGFSVTADRCFFFWEDGLQRHDEGRWTVTRPTDNGLAGWAATSQGTSFYQQLLTAHQTQKQVRVALGCIAGHTKNGDRRTGDGAFPILWADGKPAYGEITHLDMNDFSVEIRFKSPATTEPPKLHEFEDRFKHEVAKRLLQPQADRLARLRQASSIPNTTQVVATVFVRNPDTVAEVLFNANGKCKSCGSHAPFNRKSNGQPYLEVHHHVPLAAGGQDTVANAGALCPNCHRRAHYG